MKDLNLGAYDLLMKGSESGPVVVPENLTKAGFIS